MGDTQESPAKRIPCCCPCRDRFDCYVRRYASFGRSREELEEEARLCGGCECGCHYEFEDYEDGEDW